MKIYNKQTLNEIYVDFDTTNVSFLKMAAMLHSAGIKNCFFFLRLDNKKLKGVNPYDPTLSNDMKMQIFRECAHNRWYFYREVFRVLEGGASTEVGGGTSFNLNRGNLAYLWANELNISVLLIMPRQLGKTWAAIADSTWVHQFVKSSNIVHFNKSQTDANDNLRRIQLSIRMLPMYLQHSNMDNLNPSDKRMVRNNDKTIRNTINSSLEAMASAGTEAKADMMARGKTASKMWYDELSFIFFNEIIFGAATPAFEKAREIAEKNGVPYGISITTTPGDLASPHGAFAFKIMDNAIRFDESMYDTSRKKLFDIIYNTPDKTDFLFIQFNHLQLGETDSWYLKRAKKLNDPIRARREYLLEWINTNGNSPFDPDDVDLIGDLAMSKSLTVNVVRINKYFKFYEYETYTGRKPVIISVDVASGRGRDSTAIVAIHPETLKPLGIFRSNLLPTSHIKDILLSLVLNLYPNCVITIESNSIGTPVIQTLETTRLSRFLYKEKKTRVTENSISSVSKKNRRNKNYEYGHTVNQQTRAQMMDMLEDMVHYSGSHLGYPELYDELKSLVLHNGRIQHSTNTHDDTIMAYLGGLWIVRYGKGLRGKGIYYTIDTGDDHIDDDTEPSYDVRTVDRILSNSGRDEEDEYINWLSSSQPIETSSTLADRERAEYNKMIDKTLDLDDEDTGGGSLSMIPEDTQQLLLRNYNSLLSDFNSQGVTDLLNRTSTSYAPSSLRDFYM